MESRTPEEYQAELMRLYRLAHPVMAEETVEQISPPEPTPAPESDPVPTPMPEPEPDTTPEPDPEPKPDPEPEPIPEAISAPVPEIVPESAPEPAPDHPLAAQTAIGWIQVITRTGGNAMALSGVSVVITSNQGDQMQLERVAITDESGETEKIPLPVPDASLSLDSSESRQPYSTYDVSVYAPGYYRQRSERVPVFAGITSRQVFSMIPLVDGLETQPETIVFRNDEPF